MPNSYKPKTNNRNGLRAYQCRWIVPISSHPIENGIIILKDDKIKQVGKAEKVKKDLSSNLTDLGDAVVFPGLVNVHTHLEHSDIRVKSSDYFNYQKILRKYNTNNSDEKKIEETNKNIEECTKFGTVALADFSHEGLSYNQLIKSKLFARIFLEVSGFRDSESQFVLKNYQDIVDKFSPSQKISMHLAPSSVWNTSKYILSEIAIRERHIAIHLAMSKYEREFTLNGRGMLRQYLQAFEEYDYKWEAPRVSPVKYFFINHFYAKHNILVHMCNVNQKDIDIMKNAPVKSNICICPRSEGMLGLNLPPVNLLINNGINVCVGTESKSIVSDLDIRKELVECVNLFGVSPETALKFATLNGAYSIGFHKEIGSLEPGKTSRCLIARPSSKGSLTDPYEAILDLNNDVEWLE
jgi:5-methylthioadenosine/S-adenosylhomocysteine deaminase